MIVGSGRLGTGGPIGGMAEYVLVEGAAQGRSLQRIDPSVPFDVASLNEPMAVAKRAVNRARATASDKVVVFGAGPIGLGVTIWFKLQGVEHVLVVDLQEDRLKKALEVGADAVVDSSVEDVTQRLTDLHGTATNALGAPRAGTDTPPAPRRSSTSPRPRPSGAPGSSSSRSTRNRWTSPGSCAVS